MHRQTPIVLAFFLVLIVTFVVAIAIPRRDDRVVAVEPYYYTNTAGILMADVRIPRIFEPAFKMPFVSDTAVSVFATGVLQTPSGTVEEQSVLKRFGVYFATAEIPTNRWRVRFRSEIYRELSLGPLHFALRPQTNAVTTSEFPSRAEITAPGKDPDLMRR